MKVLGITGGVGAGKSTVLSYMERRYKALILQADAIGAKLQQPGNTCYRQIVELFGAEILREDATLDRVLLAKLVFADEQLLKRLNAVIHPAVKKEITDCLENARARADVPFAVIEAALLLEAGYGDICDEIWYVRADEQVRMKRLTESRGYTAERVRSIMKNQLSEREFEAGCEFVIDNSTNIVENTFEQIDKGLVEHGFL